ncbi:MAG: hypothetical protein KBC48_02435 [Candidatus Pacebacteria bacterium]|nr:hypothetical protein [Candidatus Paceibacterota bacterium]
MLSLLPELLNYSFFGTALLRVTLGIIMLWQAGRHFTRRGQHHTFTILSIIELIIAGLLIVGLYTQAAALLLVVLSLGSIILNYHHRDNTNDGDTAHYLAFHLLLAVAALTLTTLGPGAWAFDLPL